MIVTKPALRDIKKNTEKILIRKIFFPIFLMMAFGDMKSLSRL